MEGEEGEEEFEEGVDMGEEEERQKDPMATIYEHYEPSELEQKHFTSEDEKLRQTDVPERLQVPVPFYLFSFLFRITLGAREKTRTFRNAINFFLPS